MTRHCISSLGISYVIDMYWSNSVLLNACRVLWHNASTYCNSHPKFPHVFVVYTTDFNALDSVKECLYIIAKLNELVMIYIATQYNSFPF